MISFPILPKRFFLKCKGLSNARVVSVTKKDYSVEEYFL